MKAKPKKELRSKTGTRYLDCGAKEATHVQLKITGPGGSLMLPVLPNNVTRAHTRCWSWNCDVDKPTLKPSIKTTGVDSDGKDFIVHVWVTKGKVRYLDDCTHGLKGELDLEDVG